MKLRITVRSDSSPNRIIRSRQDSLIVRTNRSAWAFGFWPGGAGASPQRTNWDPVVCRRPRRETERTEIVPGFVELPEAQTLLDVTAHLLAVVAPDAETRWRCAEALKAEDAALLACDLMNDIAHQAPA